MNAVEKAITKENLKTKYNPDECVIQNNGNLICSKNNNELNTLNISKELEIKIKGNNIDVSNPETNAVNLKTTYSDKYWNRLTN